MTTGIYRLPAKSLQGAAETWVRNMAAKVVDRPGKLQSVLGGADLHQRVAILIQALLRHRRSKDPEIMRDREVLYESGPRIDNVCFTALQKDLAQESIANRKLVLGHAMGMLIQRTAGWENTHWTGMVVLKALNLSDGILQPQELKPIGDLVAKAVREDDCCLAEAATEVAIDNKDVWPPAAKEAIVAAAREMVDEYKQLAAADLSGSIPYTRGIERAVHRNLVAIVAWT